MTTGRINQVTTVIFFSSSSESRSSRRREEEVGPPTAPPIRIGGKGTERGPGTVTKTTRDRNLTNPQRTRNAERDARDAAYTATGARCEGGRASDATGKKNRPKTTQKRQRCNPHSQNQRRRPPTPSHPTVRRIKAGEPGPAPWRHGDGRCKADSRGAQRHPDSTNGTDASVPELSSRQQLLSLQPLIVVCRTPLEPSL